MRNQLKATSSNWSSAEVDLDFSKGTICIKKTFIAHINVVPSLPAVRALTGCDFVPGVYGIEKGNAISVAKKMQLVSVGQLSASLDEIVMEVRIFGITDSLSSQIGNFHYNSFLIFYMAV